MITPYIPFGERFKSVTVSLIVIIWWIGVWGLSDTIIHLVFKGAKHIELILYMLMIAFVLLTVFLYPEITKSL